MKLLFLINVLWLWSSNSIANSEIKIGVYELAPHMIIENNQPTGVVIDYLNTEVIPTFNQKEFSFKYSVLPFSRLLTELKEEHIDVACLLVKNAEREKVYQFSSKGLFVTDSALVFRKDSQIGELKSSDQLNGMSIGHTQGSVLIKFLQDSNAKIEWMAGEDSLQRNLEKLKNNRVNAVFVPTRSHVEYLLQKMKMENIFDVKVVPDTKLELYILYRKNIPNSIKDKFDKSIDEKIYLKYLMKKIKKPS